MDSLLSVFFFIKKKNINLGRHYHLWILVIVDFIVEGNSVHTSAFLPTAIEFFFLATSFEIEKDPFFKPLLYCWDSHLLFHWLISCIFTKHLLCGRKGAGARGAMAPIDLVSAPVELSAGRGEVGNMQCLEDHSMHWRCGLKHWFPWHLEYMPHVGVMWPECGRWYPGKQDGGSQSWCQAFEHSLGRNLSRNQSAIRVGSCWANWRFSFGPVS